MCLSVMEWNLAFLFRSFFRSFVPFLRIRNGKKRKSGLVLINQHLCHLIVSDLTRFVFRFRFRFLAGFSVCVCVWFGRG